MAGPNWGSYEVRLQSFYRWPLRDFHDVGELARSGLYYLFSEFFPDYTTLRCAFCNVPFDHWEPGDDPWKEHATIAPSCIHMVINIGTEQIGNIIATDARDFYVKPQSITFPGEFKQRNVNSCSPRLFGELQPLVNALQFQQGDDVDLQGATGPSEPEYTTLGGRQFKAPLNPSMSRPSHRKHTFSNMWKHAGVDIDQLVDNGLYFNETTGKCVCHYCGEGFHPSHFREDTDLWDIHAKTAECFHVITSKGETFLDEARREADAYIPGHHTGDSTQKGNEENSMDTNFLNLAIEDGMGHDGQQVSQGPKSPPKKRRRREKGPGGEVEGSRSRARKRRERNNEPHGENDGPKSPPRKRREGENGPRGETAGSLCVCNTCGSLSENPCISVREKNKTCEACLLKEELPRPDLPT